MKDSAAVPQSSPQPNVMGSGSLRSLPPQFWALIVVTGVGAGLAGGLLMVLLHAVQHLAWPYAVGDDFLTATRAAGPARRIGVLAGAGALVAGVPWLLRKRLAGGHGGDLSERIWFHAGRLDPLRTSVQAVLSIVIVGMGAAVGRESAPKQMGALIASLLAGWRRLPDAQRRLLGACGAGAGIAAVYNVPFGGAMFALEVLLGTVALSLIPAALVASGIAVAVSWLLIPNVPTYRIPAWPTDPALIVWAVLAGPVIGGVTVLYVRLIAWADERRPKGIWTILAPLMVFVALGGLALALPEVLGNGKDVVQATLDGAEPVNVLAALIVLRPLATAACLGSGAPGGLFTPTMTAGAVLGGALGAGWLAIWPGGAPGPYALIGAAAVLAAATQGPLSALVLTIELTRRLDLVIVPTLLAVAGAVATARSLDVRSIYSARIHQARAQTQDDPLAVSAAAQISELMRALARAQGQPVHVVDETGAPMGDVNAEAARHPPPSALPLETATAADFVEGKED